MNASERSGPLPETDHTPDERGPPGVDPGPQEDRTNEQPTPQITVRPDLPAEDAVETFVGGAGI